MFNIIFYSYFLFLFFFISLISEATATSTATHFGSLPATLTAATLSQTAEAATPWVELPQEHHLHLTGWDDEAEALSQAQSALIAHTYYPLRLVTKVRT